MSARRATAPALIVAALLGGGCVERRIVITSDPPGALVRLNDTEVGRTPAEVDFTWFGVYDVRLSLPGHEPLVTTAEARPSLHDYPGIDLVDMAIPGRSSTIIRWHFTLQPLVHDRDALLDRAAELRSMLAPPPEPPELPEPAAPAPPTGAAEPGA